MIHAVQNPNGVVTYSLTRRGVVAAGGALGVGLTTLVLVVVALAGQHRQESQIAGVEESQAQVILTLDGEVAHQRELAANASVAYCRLKRYESTSGEAVLRIAVQFHLLSVVAQREWKDALAGVRAIPAAARCSGAGFEVGAQAAGKRGTSSSFAGVSPSGGGEVRTMPAVPRRGGRHHQAARSPRQSQQPTSAPTPSAALTAPSSPPSQQPPSEPPPRPFIPLPSITTPSGIELPEADVHAGGDAGPPGLRGH